MTDAAIFEDGAAAEESSWMSISDMMAGLMVIFMFVLIAYVRPIVEENKRIDEIAEDWTVSREKIHAALQAEFEDDLPRWRAELEPATLTLRFRAPDVMFAQASDALTQEFESILAEFFPRYLTVLKTFGRNINEIRIEGHTSSEWRTDATLDEAYFNNMQLSQDRTRAVLKFGLQTIADPSLKEWSRRKLTANGLSSSRPILDPQTGEEDKQNSRRVEFRVVTDAERRLDDIRGQRGAPPTPGALRQ